MQWLLLSIGLVMGYAIFESLDSVFWGGLLGLLAGQAISIHRLMHRQKSLQNELAIFRQRFEQGTDVIYLRLLNVEAAQSGTIRAAVEEEQDDVSAETHVAPVESQQVPVSVIQIDSADSSVLDVSALPDEQCVPAPETIEATDLRSKPPAPSWIEPVWSAARDWLLGGNTVLRVGIVLLFIGLAFLLRYASERAVVPVEWRYIGVAAVAIAFLGLGWRLRRKMAAYGLILQGGGIAVLYLTLFAAMHLHALLSPTATFALLLLITICAAVLAIVQDSIGLAVAAILGGFATPILSSSGGGNHVGLFSYFTLLNLAIFAIAWFKAWRLLNVVGFVGTFGIGAAWGWRSYSPEAFASTEPFLILFFVLYVAIGLLFARRRLREVADGPPDTGHRYQRLKWSLQQGDYIDGTIMFGPPLIGFGLQAVAVAHIEFGMAFSALAMGLFYLVLAMLLRDRTHRTELLIEVCLALGVIFGTLAIPLGMDARWTAAAWAVEGAGLYWLGWHQRRRLARVFALLLQFGALVSFSLTLSWGEDTLLQGSAVGATMLAAALSWSYLQLRGHPVSDRFAYEQWGLPLLSILALGVALWIPALCFGRNATLLCWALIGLVALAAGLRSPSRSLLLGGVSVQVLAGVLYISNIHPGLIREGWYLFDGLQWAMSAWVAVCMVYAICRAVFRPKPDRKPALKAAIVLLLILGIIDLLAGLGFSGRFHFTLWQGNAVLLIFSGLLMHRYVHHNAGLAVLLLAGCGLFGSAYPFVANAADNDWSVLRLGMWLPLTLALGGGIGAWLMRGKTWPTLDLAWLSDVSLAWGIAWWMLTILNEAAFFVPQPWLLQTLLLAISLSGLLGLWVAKRLAWPFLALAGLLPIPFALTMLLRVWLENIHPFQAYGWLVWPLVGAVMYLSLRQLRYLLSDQILSSLHVLACGWVLILAALECRYLLWSLADGENAWGWLGWSLGPCAYLLLMAADRRWPWPVAAYPQAYRVYTAGAVAVCGMLWFWMANLMSDGSAEPLPYLPVINPLELALAIMLMACYRWARYALPSHGTGAHRWLPTAAGVSLLALLTMAVCRMAHHLFDVPFQWHALMSSMVVQSGLSVVWTLFALALMIGGNRLGRRQAWMAGALLIVLVVVKLFFIELGESGSLERIVSFIGVGVLLLIVGYFSPLPPKRSAADAEVEST